MKKLIAVLLVLGLIGGGYYLVQRFLKLNLSVFTGEVKLTTRGDLVVPITASGYIKPASITQMKSKASGEVIALPVNIGDMVRKDMLITKLLDVDEKRNVQRAQADYDQAQIAEDQAKLNLQRAEGPGLSLAQAKVRSAEVRQMKARTDFEFRKNILLKQHDIKVPEDWTKLAENWPQEGVMLTREEFVLYGTNMLDADAAVLAAKAEMKQAELAIQDAKQAIRTAAERTKTAQAILDDANQRLKETTIFSPIDGMVVSRQVQMGEVVASAKVSLTGGNLLMEIADVSAIYAVVNVDEADIGQVHKLAPPGAVVSSATQPAAQLSTDAAPVGEAETQPGVVPHDNNIVTVKVEAFPDVEFHGVITQLSPQSEAVAGVATFKVWIKIINPAENKAASGEEKKLGRPEQLVRLLNTQAEAHFTARSVHNAVLVPYDAVQRNPNAEGYGVYVPALKPGTNELEPRFVPCTLGADNGMHVEVKKGITEGQKVYTKLPLKRDNQK